MKKLLSILAAVGLSATAATTVVACATATDGINITTDKNGNASFTSKVILDRFTAIEKDKDGNFDIINPNFALVPYSKNIKEGTSVGKDTTLMNFKMVINKKYFKGVFGPTFNKGVLQKEIGVVANISFNMPTETNKYTSAFELVKTSTDSTSVVQKIERINVTVLGTGAHPEFDQNATYDGKTTITVNGRDLDKIKDFSMSKLTLSTELSKITDAKVSADGKTLTITIDKPLVQTYEPQKFTIKYDGNPDLTTSFEIAAEDAPVLSSATLSGDGTTISVKGTNMYPGDATTNNIEVKNITENETVKISSVSNDATSMTINLETPITKKFYKQNFEVNYAPNTPKLDHKLSASFSMDADESIAPKFDSASYDESTNPTITVKGSNLKNIENFDKSKLSVTGLEISDAKVSDDGNSLIITLANKLKRYTSVKTYEIKYTDDKSPLDTNLTIDPAKLTGKASWDSSKKVITITGENLGIDDKSNVTISSLNNSDPLTVDSASSTNTSLTINLKDAAPDVFYDNSYTINYTTTGGDNLTAPLDSPADASKVPALSSAKLNDERTQITVSVSNADQIKNFNKDNLKITGGNGVKINDAKLDGTTMTIDVDAIAKISGDTPTTYTISYELGHGVSPATTTFKVDPAQALGKATYDDSNKTITVQGTNLVPVDSVDLSKDLTITGLPTGVAASSAKATETALTIILSGNIPTSYYKDWNIQISYTNDGTKLASTLVINKDTSLTPTFSSAKYDATSKTITVTGAKLSNIENFNQNNLKVIDDKNGDLTIASAKIADDSSLSITLQDELLKYKDKKNYIIEYKDSTGLDAKTTLVNPATTFTSMTVSGSTINITGTNLQQATDIDLKNITVTNGKTDLKVDKAVATDSSLAITLDATINPKFYSQDIAVTYLLSGKDKISTSYTMPADASLTPAFGEKATLNDARTQATIDVTNAQYIENFDWHNLKADSLKITAGELDTKAGKLVVTFNKIEKTPSTQNFTITYSIGHGKADLSSSFSVNPKQKLDASATIKGNVITVGGSNLVPETNAKDHVQIGNLPSGISISSASATENELTINLNEPISVSPYSDQTFKISYTNDDAQLQSTLTVNSDSTLAPHFASAEYDVSKRTITISGTHLKNFNKFDSKNFSVKAESTSVNLDIASANDDSDTQVTITLKNPIPKYDIAMKFDVSYDDTSVSVQPNVITFETSKTSFASMSIDSNDNQTIDIQGADLAGVIDPNTLNITNNGNKINVISASATDSTMKVKVDETLIKKAFAQNINVDWTLSGKGKASTSMILDADPSLIPTLSDAKVANDFMSLTVKMSNSDQINFDPKAISISNGADIKSVGDPSNDGLITIQFNKPLEQSKKTTYTLTYTFDSSLGLKPTTTTFDVRGKATLNSTGEYTANSDGSATITVSGTNLGNNPNDKATINGVDASNIDSVTTVDTMLTIKLKKAIAPSYTNKQTFTITYSTDNQTFNPTFDVPVDTSIEPIWDKTATYDYKANTITITGKNFGNWEKWDDNNLSVANGNDKLVISKIDHSASNIVVTLAKNQISQFTASKDYAITYKDSVLNLTTTATVGAVSINDISYADGTITMNGTNLWDTTDTTGFDIDGDASNIKSVTISDNVITVKVADALINSPYGGDHKLNYKLSGGETITKDFTIAGNPEMQPSFTQATYDNQTITVTGKNLDKIDNWDQNKLVISPSVDIASVTRTADSIVIKLSKDITRTTNGAQTFTISYPVGHELKDLSTTFTLNPAKLTGTPSLSSDKKTITISGENLGTTSGTAKVGSMNCKAYTTNNSLSINLSTSISDEYWNQEFDISYSPYTNYSLTSEISFTGVSSMKPEIQKVEAVLTGDGDTTNRIKIEGKNFKNIPADEVNDKSKWEISAPDGNYITADSKNKPHVIDSIDVNDTEIIITLTKKLPYSYAVKDHKTPIQWTIDVSYNDSHIGEIKGSETLPDLSGDASLDNQIGYNQYAFSKDEQDKDGVSGETNDDFELTGKNIQNLVGWDDASKWSLSFLKADGSGPWDGQDLAMPKIKDIWLVARTADNKKLNGFNVVLVMDGTFASIWDNTPIGIPDRPQIQLSFTDKDGNTNVVGTFDPNNGSKSVFY